MAARKQLWHPDEVRRKIQASQLINRLTAHALSEAGPLMDASQVQAARLLLDKVLPNLQSVAVGGDENSGPVKISVSWLPPQ